jgi:hypothetical protein
MAGRVRSNDAGVRCLDEVKYEDKDVSQAALDTHTTCKLCNRPAGYM